jgi:hypothetical protein
MALNKTWEFTELKGDGGIISSVAWSIVWTDPDNCPGTEVRTSGVTADGIAIAVPTVTKREIELAVEASLGQQLEAIQAHAAEMIAFRHRVDNLAVIDLPEIVTPPSAAGVQWKTRQMSSR